MTARSYQNPNVNLNPIKNLLIYLATISVFHARCQDVFLFLEIFSCPPFSWHAQISFPVGSRARRGADSGGSILCEPVDKRAARIRPGQL